MPRITILMPAFNAAAGLVRAMESTLSALPRDSEIAVWDDGSFDETALLLERYESNARVKIYSDGTNIGVARGLNRLMELTDSEIVGRMDSDDRCLPWRFAHSLNELRRSDADVVFSTAIHADSKLKITRPSLPLRISSTAFPYALILRNPVAHGTMLGSRRAINAVGAYRNVAAEDYDLWLRLALNRSRLVRTGIPGLVYRHHAGQVTNDPTWRERAQGEDETANSHADLVELLLGIRIRAFEDLRSPGADTTRITQIQESLGDLLRTRTLSPIDKLVMRNELRSVNKVFSRLTQSNRKDW